MSERHCSHICECGNKKKKASVQCWRCSKLEEKRTSLFGRKNKTVGVRAMHESFSDVNAACTKFLASRGLETKPWFHTPIDRIYSINEL